MINIAARFRAVRAEEARLKEETPELYFWMVSLEDPTRDMHGGVMVQVNRYKAAEATIDRTHRMATSEEIAKHLSAEEVVRNKAEDLARRRELLLSPVIQQLNPTPPAIRQGKGDK